MVGNRGADTKPERALRSELHARGLRFFKNRSPTHGVSPRANSDYWRAKLDRNVARDRRNNESLSEAGWDVVRVWEHEDPRRAAETITDHVLNRRRSPQSTV
jgi:DNA mismatch endonuclease (patch repair protein)